MTWYLLTIYKGPPKCYDLVLLHRVCWNPPATYQDMMMQYSSYLDKKYGKGCSIIFWGVSSTKDHEHQRRSKHSFTEVVFQSQNEVHCKQNFYLTATTRSDLLQAWRLFLVMQTRLLKLLCRLQKMGHMQLLLLMILMFWWHCWTSRGLSLRTYHFDMKQGRTWTEQCQRDDLLTTESCFWQLSVHSCVEWLRPTYAIYSHGKRKLLKVVERSQEAIAESCSTFKHPLSSQGKVASAGIQLFLRLYGMH